MRSNKIETYKLTLKLNGKQRSILVGTLLGDGHLETQSNGRTYRLKIEHSARQLTYVDWLYEQFKDWVLTPPKLRRKRLGELELENYCFQTLSSGQFRFYGKQFYDEFKHKRVPRQIKRWLTPLALAVWFMDDGSAKSKWHRAIILNTHCFSKKDLALLQEALSFNYKIEATLRPQKEGLQLLIAGPSAERFVKIVRPHILPEFNYKFGALEQQIA